MAIAKILINQLGNISGTPDESRDDILLTNPVLLISEENDGVNEYKWEMISKPENSSAILENDETSVATFIPDEKGSYLIQLTINGTISSRKIASVKTDILALRLPAEEENGEFDGGYDSNIINIIKELEANIEKATSDLETTNQEKEQVKNDFDEYKSNIETEKVISGRVLELIKQGLAEDKIDANLKTAISKLSDDEFRVL